MERERLIELLTDDTGSAAATPAAGTCRRGLVDGAEFVVYEETLPAESLAATYARRELHLSKLGLDSLGFAESVRGLSALPADTQLRLGHVGVEDPPFSFVLFLDKEATRVVGCVGVARNDPPKGTDEGGL
ncbi:hypothetical protein AB0I28_29435 [Phytomonospora sp. NPDC050363]|uniref:hypothetical protein n=1 Tax=Phytomonospora sp. NPDC050363 TaxID=3155642 RepID=UPI00340B1623